MIAALPFAGKLCLVIACAIVGFSCYAALLRGRGL